ncbi:putative cyclin-dependent protein kinase regulator [Papiliotrema laurentii]|uniref:Cyclin-dependent protein kinase regulator n=1 Tax=Papiliotrema laurentii TaxID=5418 RepID=A0AAD9L8Y2_PAPLA|nr:putative cyclin-dependent protein kinase regulator [Papiliotrema laurentii]
MATRQTARRTVRSTRTDENSIPTQQTVRTKSSLSNLGPAQRSTVVPTKKPVTASTNVKAGAKRTALGGVVTNIVKAEPRQPLSSRTNGTNQTRPIAPVPQRAKVAVYANAELAVPEEDEDAVSEMDVDVRREIDTKRDLAIAEPGFTIEDDGSSGDMSEEEEEEEDDEDWLRMTEEESLEVAQQLHQVRSTFQDEVDLYDTTMVAEYADDIFQHMEALEESVMPNPKYMNFQTEIEWTMRTTLIDWLLQVHLRYHMLPETLWIAVNIVDRFLSVRVVSLVKLQLVGVTAMFIAAKYEEILAPSVDEFVFMTENGYTKEEILKGERIILQTLDFTISSYCSPYSWVRKISKADDYDIQTRTLSKFLMEVTLLDHRFLRCKASMIAAIGMYLARKMLGGDWNEAFIYYSNFTESQLIPGAMLLCERLVEDDFESVYVYKKYANKKFLRASTFARDWAQNHSGAGWCE